jgi:acetoin utilization protein AcuC
MPPETLVFVGDAFGKTQFPSRRLNTFDRQAAFWEEAHKRGLDRQVRIAAPRLATRDELLRFHDAAHVQWVEVRSRIGSGLIDDEDTPAYPGVYEAHAHRVGAALEGLSRIMAGEARRSFQPIGGLHHARRHRGAGFCVFSDIGVVIESLRREHGVQKVAYVDIDAHHGDGVYDSYAGDAQLIFADIHEDGRFLYPGSGDASEIGTGAAAGTKLNAPLAPGADDAAFYAAWERIEAHLAARRPEFFILQCGADSIAGDPLADLCLSPAAHAHAARSLVQLADRYAQGRLMVFGGGGYLAGNVAAAWSGVLQQLIAADR